MVRKYMLVFEKNKDHNFIVCLEWDLDSTITVKKILKIKNYDESS